MRPAYIREIAGADPASPTKVCTVCGKMLVGRQLKFCGVLCKAKFYDVFKKKHIAVCLQCGESFVGWRKVQKFCSVMCSNVSRRRYLSIPDCLDSADRKLDKNIGYVRLYVPMHSEANSWGYVYEHRVVAEQKIGRSLLPGEVVHHVNGVRHDNRPENLEVMSGKEHSKLPSLR